MIRIQSRLPRDRQHAGTLEVYRDEALVLGPVRARGEADNTGAASHRNAVEDPTKSFGDHPGGRYRVVRMVPSTTDRQRTYGPVFFALDPVDGEALAAKRNGRTGIGIHGGRLHDDGRLRETYGCLRIDNDVAEQLAKLVEPELAAGHDVFYACEVAG